MVQKLVKNEVFESNDSNQPSDSEAMKYRGKTKTTTLSPTSDSDIEIDVPIVKSKKNVKSKNEKKSAVKKDDELRNANPKVKSIKSKKNVSVVSSDDDNDPNNMSIEEDSDGDSESTETQSHTETKDKTKDKKKNGPSPIPRSLAKRVQTNLKEMDAEASDVSLDKIQEILTTYRTMTIDDVAKGISVSEPNFFTYKRKVREERVHSNPKTNTKIVKPRHYVLCVEVKASTKNRFAEIPLEEKDIEILDNNLMKKKKKNNKSG